MEIAKEENINFNQLPISVTQEMLIKYGLSTLLKKHNGSPSNYYYPFSRQIFR